MTTTPFAVLFPGQGSQKPGMGKSVFDAFPAAQTVFADIRDATGIDVAQVCFESDEETLRRTENTQIALFTVSVATFVAFVGEMNPPRYPLCMAGHSVGEYAALVCSGRLGVAEGARLVQRRGDLMARVGTLRPGGMAAILGLDDEAVDEVCSGVSRDGSVVVVANYNCPGQVVISGDKSAVEEASLQLKAHGAKRCLALNVSGAFHSPLMADAQEAMGEALQSTEFRNPSAAPQVISNVTAAPEETWPELMQRQLGSPVRWTESVRAMYAIGARLFIECGSGEVLSGLTKRIVPEAQTAALVDADSLRLARDFC